MASSPISAELSPIHAQLLQFLRRSAAAVADVVMPIVALLTKHPKTLLNIVKHHETLVKHCDTLYNIMKHLKHHETVETLLKHCETSRNTRHSMLRYRCSMQRHRCFAQRHRRSAPLEFFFQEQSYSSLHSGQSLSWDHVRRDIDDRPAAAAGRSVATRSLMRRRRSLRHSLNIIKHCKTS